MTPANRTYAGRLERLFAYLIDVLILFLANSAIAAGMATSSAQETFIINPASILVMFACNAIYYTAFTSSNWQATPGKRLLGLYVMRANGQPLSQRDAFERFLAFTLPSLPVYTSFIPEDLAKIMVVWLSLFWFAPILTSAQRIGVHDKLCGTRVVVGRRGS